MKKMQESMKKKYSCDRSTTATRLEDLLQDAAVSGDCSHWYMQMFMYMVMPDKQVSTQTLLVF